VYGRDYSKGDADARAFDRSLHFEVNFAPFVLGECGVSLAGALETAIEQA
jgi:hypothetical protein